MDSADRFARAHGLARAHGSYEAMLADPDIDAVYISLPNSLHHPWTIRALDAGKHVLCEKPFASSLQQAREMIEVANRRGRVLAEAFMYQTHPLTRAVLKAVRGGVIGQVRMIRCSFCFKVSQWRNNIRFDPSLHGGVMMDVGCYCISFSRLFAGAEPASIHVVHHRHESGVDDMAVGTLAFPNGVLAVFSCGMSAHADNTTSICGTEGYIEIPVPWKPPGNGAMYILGRSTPPKMEDPAAPPPPPRQTFVIDEPVDLYGNEADAFARAALDGEPFPVSHADTLGNQAALDEVRRQIGARS